MGRRLRSPQGTAPAALAINKSWSVRSFGSKQYTKEIKAEDVPTLSNLYFLPFDILEPIKIKKRNIRVLHTEKYPVSLYSICSWISLVAEKYADSLILIGWNLKVMTFWRFQKRSHGHHNYADFVTSYDPNASTESQLQKSIALILHRSCLIYINAICFFLRLHYFFRRFYYRFRHFQFFRIYSKLQWWCWR